MSSYNTNEFRSGLKICSTNDPYAIVENEFVKPGKGQAFNRVKIRNLKDRPRPSSAPSKSGESVDAADVVDMDSSTSTTTATSGTSWSRRPSSSTQLRKTVVGEGAIWLKDGDVCIITLWNNVPLLVTPPAHVELKVVETDPGVRGDTATGGQKTGQAPNRCGGARAALHQ